MQNEGMFSVKTYYPSWHYFLLQLSLSNRCFKLTLFLLQIVKLIRNPGKSRKSMKFKWRNPGNIDFNFLICCSWWWHRCRRQTSCRRDGPQCWQRWTWGWWAVRPPERSPWTPYTAQIPPRKDCRVINIFYIVSPLAT